MDRLGFTAELRKLGQVFPQTVVALQHPGLLVKSFDVKRVYGVLPIILPGGKAMDHDGRARFDWSALVVRDLVDTILRDS